MPVSDDTRIADPNYMQSLARGLDVLRAFERHASLSAAEAARLSGLNRPSASRCLHTLQCLGYVSEENGRYALTPRFLPLASGYLSSSPLASAIQAVANASRDRPEETLPIATIDPSDLGHISYIARAAIRRAWGVERGCQSVKNSVGAAS